MKNGEEDTGDTSTFKDMKDKTDNVVETHGLER